MRRPSRYYLRIIYRYCITPRRDSPLVNIIGYSTAPLSLHFSCIISLDIMAHRYHVNITGYSTAPPTLHFSCIISPDIMAHRLHFNIIGYSTTPPSLHSACIISPDVTSRRYHRTSRRYSKVFGQAYTYFLSPVGCLAPVGLPQNHQRRLVAFSSWTSCPVNPRTTS